MESKMFDSSGTAQLPDIHIAQSDPQNTPSSVKVIRHILGIKEVKKQEGDQSHNVLDNPSSNNKSSSSSPISKHVEYNGVIDNDSSSRFQLPPFLENIKQKILKKPALKIGITFFVIFLLILTAFMAILSIYWGSLFRRPSYFKNLKFLVLIEDNEIDSIPPLIGDTLSVLLSSPEARQVGNFQIYSQNSPLGPLDAQFEGESLSPYEKVEKLVHGAHYWGGFYVPKNATFDYFTALKTSDSKFNTSVVTFVYESARSIDAVPTIVLSIVSALEESFVLHAQESVTLPLLNLLTEEQKLDIAIESPGILTSLWFHYINNRPVLVPTVIGPLQLGLIYLLIMSFHQFNFASEMHYMIKDELNAKQYMVYHIITSQGAYVLMSFVYCLMTLAFQVSVTVTFGHSGFLVLWAFVFLTMSALGGINENVAIQIFIRNKTVVGFWLLFFLVINICPVVSPIALMNVFYRYGYAMPMYNGYELIKVVLLNTNKNAMGRQIGILIAYIVVSNAILPLNFRSVERHRAKMAKISNKANTKLMG